jgi:NitT/TauT family transport system permease protein
VFSPWGFFVKKYDLLNGCFWKMRSTLRNKTIIRLALIFAIVFLWYVLLGVTDLPEFILPAPHAVLIRLFEEFWRGQILYHIGVTFLEFSSGLLLGALVAIFSGYLIAHSKKIELVLSPVLTASQAIPMVAVAPLFVLWFGPGLFSKILVCAMIIFFPVLVNTIHGLKSIPPDLKMLFSTLHASKMDTIRLLEIPASLPTFLSGLKIGATLSVTGAIVGEFIGADKGLGYLINVARGQYDTAFVFGIVLVLILMALALYRSVEYLEKRISRETEEEVLK